MNLWSNEAKNQLINEVIIERVNERISKWTGEQENM